MIFGLLLAMTTPPSMSQSAAAAVPAKAEHVQAQLIADTSAIQPGQPFHLGVLLKMQPDWHTYYKDPGDAGVPTRIDWQLPSGFTTKSLQWERPNRFNE